ncbi:unnamed protein product [Effrenium voratum]|uniref:Uncharacterized protein n=1 Tax=Effrenium voratum TaxID=2562239 RepID=A0AA36HK44_9DINO|nr:unnamed protein product [Effrenium voratum]
MRLRWMCRGCNPCNGRLQGRCPECKHAEGLERTQPSKGKTTKDGQQPKAKAKAAAKRMPAKRKADRSSAKKAVGKRPASNISGKRDLPRRPHARVLAASLQRGEPCGRVIKRRLPGLPGPQLVKL